MTCAGHPASHNPLRAAMIGFLYRKTAFRDKGLANFQRSALTRHQHSHTQFVFGKSCFKPETSQMFTSTRTKNTVTKVLYMSVYM